MDWAKIIEELKRRGWTQKDLAAELNVAQSSVSDLANGKTRSPAYQVGRQLELLHASNRVPAAKAA